MNLLIFKLVNFNKQKKTLLRNTKSNFLEVTLYFPPPLPFDTHVHTSKIKRVVI